MGSARPTGSNEPIADYVWRSNSRQDGGYPSGRVMIDLCGSTVASAAGSFGVSEKCDFEVSELSKTPKLHEAKAIATRYRGPYQRFAILKPLDGKHATANFYFQFPYYEKSSNGEKLAIHTYHAIDKSVLGSCDRDENAKLLFSRMAHYGYPENKKN